MRKLLTKLIYKLGYQKKMCYPLDYKVMVANEVAFELEGKGDDDVPIFNWDYIVIIERGIFKGVGIAFSIDDLIKNGQKFSFDVLDNDDLINYWGYGMFDNQVKLIVKDMLRRIK